jgi:N-acetylmuramoyl-L-alanine amidase
MRRSTPRSPGWRLPGAALCLSVAVGSGAHAATLPALDPAARDAIARVAYAEAGNQGDSGLAGVVFTILNRLASGAWGSSVEAVVDAPRQFEPVMRAGGDWRRLPDPSAAQRAHIETILNLALDGRLPDLTNGARYFQNPQIVAARAARGEVSPRLVGFGGATPTAVIGAHAFYAGPARGGARPAVVASAAAPTLFVGETHAQPDPSSGGSGRGEDLGQALFISRDGAAIAEAGTP